MKKLSFILACVALVAFAACNKEADTQITEGNSIEAVFEVSAPELATKTIISDGLTADQLFFFLYDKEGKLLFNTNSSVLPAANAYPVTFDKLGDKKWSVKVRLIKGMTYKLAFWAQKKMDTGNPFSFDAAGEALTVNYDNVTMNSDNYDAFWGTVGVDSEFIVNGPATKVVTLKRPFAQLNVGAPAADYQVVSYTLGKYGKEASAITSQYTIKGTVPNTMNLLSGEVSGNAADPTDGLILKAAAQPNATLTSGGADYQHLAMAYVLVGDKVTNDVTLTVNTGADAIGAAGVLTRDVLNVPLQRNYRTNIIGNIFSVEEEFTVEVDNAFGETGTGAYGDVHVPDYVPTFDDIVDLNAELAKGVNAVALDMTAVNGTINLPNTTEDIYLYILNDLSAASNVLNVVYTEGAAAHPANLYIYAKNLKTLNGTVPDTHVEIYSYSHIDTGTISTSGTTLVIQPFAYYGNLIIKKGGLKVEGKVAEASLQPTNPAEPINVTIIKDAAEGINGQVVVLNVKAGITSVSTEDSQGGEPNVDSAAAEEDKPAVGTMNVIGGSATVEENSTVTTVNQSGSGTVSISENADVETVEAENPGNITGAGAADVEFLIKNEAQLTAAIETKKASMKIGADFACTRGYVLDYSAEIDLNGYAITFNGVPDEGREYVAEGFTQSRAFKVVGSADFTLKNGSVLLNEALLGSVRFDSTGKLTLENYITTNYRGWGLNIKLEDGTAELKNVTVTSQVGGCLEVNGPAQATLSGCTFTQTGEDSESWISSAISVAYAGVVNVASGTYSGVYGAYAYTSGGTINLNGGTVSGSKAALILQTDRGDYPTSVSSINVIPGVEVTGALRADAQYCNLTISGGLFAKGAAEHQFVINPASTVSITGGTFDEDPSAYVSADYGVRLKDGKYQVGIFPKEINISTAEEFINVFSDPATKSKNTEINILADIDLSSSAAHEPFDISNSENASITVNGNGHTITGMKKPMFDQCFVASIAVNNLTFDSCNITEASNGYVAVIAAYFDAGKYLNVENVTFDNCSLSGSNYGGVIYGAGGGYGNQDDGPVHMGALVKNCTFNNCSIASTGGGSVGTIAGHAAWNEWTKLTVEGCSVENCTLTTGKLNKAGSYFGTVGVAGGTVYGRDCGVYVKNCTWNGNNAVAKEVKSPYIFGRVASEGGELYVWENGDYVLAAHNYDAGEENDVVDRADLVTE